MRALDSYARQLLHLPPRIPSSPPHPNPARWRGLEHRAKEHVGTQLEGLDAYGADLSGSLFSDVQARSANFDFTYLSECEFAHTDLRNASMIGSYGYYIHEEETQWDGANLAGANWYDSNTATLAWEPDRVYLEGFYWNDELVRARTLFAAKRAGQIRIFRRRPPGDESGGIWRRLRYTDPEEAGERGANTLADHVEALGFLHAGSLLELQLILQGRRVYAPADRALEGFTARLRQRLFDGQGNLRYEVYDEADRAVPEAETLFAPWTLQKGTPEDRLLYDGTVVAHSTASTLRWLAPHARDRERLQQRWDTYVQLQHRPTAWGPAPTTATVLQRLRKG